MTSFQKLRTTLEEVFSATVHNEDELNYASATLILAGLLQIHAHSLRYASHRARLESFPNHGPSPISSEEVHSGSSSWTHTLSSSPHPSPGELASAGFFHTGSGDETVCPACGLGLREWQSTDQPVACHLAYSSTEVRLRTCGADVREPTPVLSCLYLAVHRLLTSELPLARKSLVPVGSVQSVCLLPGIIASSLNRLSSGVSTASLADRLHAIARIMASPPSPQGWPIENARSLGHSDDLIVLALWRLQAETTGMGLVCPPTTALRLDPQATAELLRAILRMQEEFDDTTLDELPSVFGSGSLDGYDDVSGISDGELTAEDAETAALSRCRHQRMQQHTLSTTSRRSAELSDVMNKPFRLPHLYEFVSWWSSRWPLEK